MRKSGLDVLGKVPWGTHFCSSMDPGRISWRRSFRYFAAGLAHDECCMWVTSAPLGVEEATSAMRVAVPALDAHIARRQITFLDYSNCTRSTAASTRTGCFAGWVTELQAATARGFDGLRLTATRSGSSVRRGNIYQHEAAIDRVIGQTRCWRCAPIASDRCGGAESST